jgi:endonuclease YncB( thermonuclease family)
MKRPLLLTVIALLALTAVACSAGNETVAAEAGETVVDHIADGDTLELESGDRVRLVQIDATELGEGECYSEEAMDALEELAPPGTRVRLEADPNLDQVDRFGRLLRYVHVGDRNVNLELVRRGAAAPYFFHGEHGKYASELEDAGEAARDANRGMWGACRVAWNPARSATAQPR